MAGAALSALIRKQNLLCEEKNYGHYHLGCKFLNQYVRLDAAAAKALNLFAEPRTPKNASLFGVLDHCQTRMGRSMLQRWVRHPLVDLPTIERRHAMVEIFHQDTALREALKQDCLKGVSWVVVVVVVVVVVPSLLALLRFVDDCVDCSYAYLPPPPLSLSFFLQLPDLSRIVLKLKRGTAALKDLWDLRTFAKRLPSIVETLNTHEGNAASQLTLSSEFSDRLTSLLEEFQLYVAFTDSAIDLEAAGRGRLRVNPDLSDELRELKNQIDNVNHAIEQYLEQELPR